MNGISQPIWQPIFSPIYGAVTSSIAEKFNVLSLFSAGEKGAWWDNQDLATMFQDSAGTISVTAAGQSIGKQLDKSGNGNHRTQTTSANRPVLAQRSDGIYYISYAGGKSLSVPTSTASFNYLHDGTGGTIVAFVEWLQGTSASNYLLTAASTSQNGFQLVKSGTTQNVNCNICRGSSGVFTAQPVISRLAVSSAPRMMRFSYKNDGLPSDGKSSVDDSFNVNPYATVNAPAIGNAGSNLQVATSFNSYEYGVVIRSGVLSENQISGLWSYFRNQDYPVPSVDLTLILGGQSNMSGRGTIVTTLAEEKLVGVYSYTKAEEFRIATVPEHSIDNCPVPTSPNESNVSAPQHGLSLMAGKSIKSNSNKNTLLIPCAIGSTSIEQWDTPETSNDRTTLFGAMVYRYSQSEWKNGSPVIVWYGHEADAGKASPDFVSGGVGNAYQTLLSDLFQDVRDYTVNAPIVFCQLSADDDLAVSSAQAAAGEAMRQMELSVSNAFLVVTHDLQRNAAPDDIHISRPGVAPPLGERVALAIRQHVLGESVNGTGPRIVGASHAGAVVTLTCNKAINASAGNYGNLFRVYDNGIEATVSSAIRNADTTKIDITCSSTLTGSVTLTYGYRAGLASAPRTDIVMDSDSMPLPLFGPIVA